MVMSILPDNLLRAPCKVLTTASEAETLALAAKLAKMLEPGDFLALLGGLGSGKTVFVRGLGQALGLAQITSPTFVLAQTHNTPEGKSMEVHHVDVRKVARLSS